MIEGKRRYTTYLIVMVLKIALFFGLFLGLTSGLNGVHVKNIFTSFGESFWGLGYKIAGGIPGSFKEHLPLKILAVQVLGSYITYVFSKFACKVKIQIGAFAWPITLVMPATLATVMGLCWVRSDDPCAYENVNFPNHLFFQCPVEFNGNYTFSYILFDKDGLYLWVSFLMILSQVWIARHIWKPKSQRLAPTEQMFGNNNQNDASDKNCDGNIAFYITT